MELVITDHLAWDDLDSHCRMLQDKINTYLEFIESGQLLRMKEPTIPPDPVIRICLAVQHAPTPAARAFLARVEAFLVGAGVGFEVDVRQAT